MMNFYVIDHVASHRSGGGAKTAPKDFLFSSGRLSRVNGGSFIFPFFLGDDDFFAVFLVERQLFLAAIVVIRDA